MKGQCKISKILKCVWLTSLLATMCGSSGKTLATELTTKDVTPPWGRLKIVGATTVGDVNYVDGTNIEVEVYADDDICANNEIQYYISTSEISDTAALDESSWKNYSAGVKENITLPNASSTNVIYAIFRDKSGNTSLIYNGTNVQYTIEYNANGGTEAPTGVGTTAYYGMPFAVTMQTPKKDGHYFLGWSTDPTAGTPSYRAGDIIPASAFKGGSKTVTLYAVWTTNKNELPDLADVVIGNCETK